MLPTPPCPALAPRLAWQWVLQPHALSRLESRPGAAGTGHLSLQQGRHSQAQPWLAPSSHCGGIVQSTAAALSKPLPSAVPAQPCQWPRHPYLPCQ